MGFRPLGNSIRKQNGIALEAKASVPVRGLAPDAAPAAFP